MTFPQSSSNEIRRKIGSERIPPNPGSSEENTSTSNSKTSTLGSSASATDSMSHVNAGNNNMVSESNDQDANRKSQMTWTQFDEVDIDSREYNNKLYYTV